MAPTFNIYLEQADKPAATLSIASETGKPLTNTVEMGKVEVAFLDPQLERILEQLLQALPGIRRRQWMRDIGPGRRWGVSSCNEVAYALTKLPHPWTIRAVDLPPLAQEEEQERFRY